MTLIAEGKTKEVYRTQTHHVVIIRNKPKITKHDTPELTEQFAKKGVYVNIVTCAVFELLQRRGVPVAWIQKHDADSYSAYMMNMIPLEVVWRDRADGSYLQRRPDLKADGPEPLKLDAPLVESFLKTDEQGTLIMDDETIVEGVSFEGKPIADPLIIVNGDKWDLYHPKMPNTYLGVSIDPIVSADILVTLTSYTLNIGVILSEAWDRLQMHLVDFKLEYGFDADGKLRLGDSLGPDEWRLRTWDWEKEWSKQPFRDMTGEADLGMMDTIYGQLAQLAPRLLEDAS